MPKKLSSPIIVINFKTYLESLGENGLRLAKIAERVAEDFGVCICVAPQYVDLRDIARSVNIPVFAQHVDHNPPGSFTGYVTVDAIKNSMVDGSIVNHSERRIELTSIATIVRLLKRNGLYSLVCADDVDSAMAVATLNPTMVAIEPPELIGTGISVSKAKPEIITEGIKMIRAVNKDVKILCGAGITNGEDVRKAIELGVEGVLLASGVVKAKDPESVLRDMASNAIRAYRS